jgi:hypothetical protein
LYAHVITLTNDPDQGFQAKVNGEQFELFKEFYENSDYTLTDNGELCDLSCDSALFRSTTPLFVHSYILNSSVIIPNLYISKPFFENQYLSQIGMTYVTSYFLGMLVRYYPTHWVSMLRGEKGDEIWPTINRAQQCIESTYPKLVIELINDLLTETA